MTSTPPSLQPCIEGPTLRLRPMEAGDFERLHQAASDPLIWSQHPNPLRYQRPVFQGWFDDGMASGGALVAVDRATGNIIGASRYYDWNEADREVAIGFTFLSRDYWGGATNAELKRLMLQHAFQWARTVWFHIGPQNMRSRRAMEKIGGQFSHQASKQMSGGSQEYCYYKIDRERFNEIHAANQNQSC